MKVYTKSGDDGTTGIVGGKRLDKDSLRIKAYGEIDELNSIIGIIQSKIKNHNQKSINQISLKKIQDNLFCLGSQIACEKEYWNKYKIPSLDKDLLEYLEKEIDLWISVLPELKSFVLPGGTEESSFCHLGRTVCRRAERSLVSFNESKKDEKNEESLKFINRLSDYLFTLALFINLKSEVKEISWP